MPRKDSILGRVDITIVVRFNIMWRWMGSGPIGRGGMLSLFAKVPDPIGKTL